MTLKKKARLTLLQGKQSTDIDALARLFEKTTGRSPTSRELVVARKKLKAKRSP